MKERIIELLKQNTSLNIIDINDILGLNTSVEFSELQELLNRMCEEGILYHSNKDKYLLFENSHLVKGKLQLKSSGYGFILGTGLEKDIYINEKDINGALDGDIVAVEVTNKKDFEGKIVKILKRNDKVIIGEVVVKDNKFYVVTNKSGNDIYIPNDKLNGAVEGHKVVVKRDENNRTRGEIVTIIGHKNDVGVDILSYVYEYSFKPKFPDEVMLEVDNIPDSVLDKEYEGRVDLRDKKVFTIDGADTKDIDDAVFCYKNEDDTYTLGVCIADVSHYVKMGSKIDIEAYERGTSVYLVDRVLPMLPHKLSNGICSLNPEVDRLALSCIMKIDNKGNVIHYDICDSIIRSRKKMTYDAVNSILEKDIVPEGYEEFVDDLKVMNDLSNILRNKMLARGYIDFNTKEAKILVDEKCHPYEIKLREQRTGEKLIENFMIVANETVASSIFYRSDGVPGIYRVHDKPNEAKLQKFMDFLSVHGYSVTGKKKGKISVKDLRNLIDQIEDEKVKPILNELLVRAMAKAVYSEENIGHFGLGSKCYSHFTSPIRRYPDLILHRLVKLYNGDYDYDLIDYFKRELSVMCEHTSARERDADSCERDVDKMKMAEYMEDHIGEVFEGVISGVQEFGIFVELPNTVEGLIRIEDLPGYYTFSEKAMTLYDKKSGRKFGFGDEVKVKVVKASRETSTVDFVLVKELERSEESNKTKKKVKGR